MKLRKKSEINWILIGFIIAIVAAIIIIFIFKEAIFEGRDDLIDLNECPIDCVGTAGECPLGTTAVYGIGCDKEGEKWCCREKPK